MADETNVSTNGRWSDQETTPGDATALNDDDGVYAIHAALMHTGKILLFSGRTDESGGNRNLYRSWSWDPSGHIPGQPLSGVTGRWFVPGFDENAELPVDADGNPEISTLGDPDINLFCSFHVFREDGKLLVVGGDSPSLNPGSPDAHPSHDNRAFHLYDPESEAWSRLSSRMYLGRWYPTCVVMPDGRITIFSGNTTFGYSGITSKVEIVGPPNYVRDIVEGGQRPLFIYPGMHLVRGGRIFYTSTAWRYNGSSESQVESRIDSTDSFVMTGENASGEPTGSWQPHNILPANPMREEGTSVLLPPARDGRILLIGGGWWDGSTLQGDAKSVEILDTQTSPLGWEPAGEMHFPRVNVTAVLLPNGKVLILGGHDKHKWNHDHANHSDIAEIYDPSIAYDETDPTAAFSEVAEMHRPRLYHSVALLLPDGRVFAAGGIEAERNMEFYEPPYLHQGTQPEIDSILRDDVTAPGGTFVEQVRYGGIITIGYTTEAPINKVVLMRPGSITHHTNTEQRYEDISISPTTGASGTFRARIPSDPSVLPPGYYMLWIVDDQGRPCKMAKFVRLSHEHCTLVTDKSHFSIDEYDAITFGAGSVADFDNALYVIVHGFIPSQIGIATTTPNAAQLVAYAPNITFTDSDGNGVSGITEYPSAMYLEVEGESLDVRQRITFEYGIRFTGSGLFPPDTAGAPDTRRIRLATAKRGYTCTGEILLTRQPNPFMWDGPKHWLSMDVRVFPLKAGESIVNPAQVPVVNAASPDPNPYIARLLDYYNGLPVSAGHPFNSLDTDQQGSKLYLASELDDTRVFNFAVAQVRYRGLALTADNVRVFFRMFTTAVTSLEFRGDTYPRRTVNGHVLPDVGRNATDILSIPFFAAPWNTLDMDGDPANVKTLVPDTGGAEVHTYFGVWLDFNQEAAQTTTRIDDPEDGEPKTIQELIRGQHQCLVAEIYFEDDLIANGATPANNDNLSQRNLAIVSSDNPGGPDSHTVEHTFDIRPTWFVQQPAGVMAAAAIVAPPQRGRLGGPDELMILWGNLPRDSEATIFMPQLNADEIVTLANQDYGPRRIERVDAHTIQCRVADVTYIPLPALGPRHIAALLTIQLPDSVKKGQEFRVEVRQISHVQERVVGAFELLIPVSTADALLADEIRTLSVMRHIATKISVTSRWYPIFQRYLAGFDGRVRGFGGDPTRVGGSPRGDGGQTRPPRPATPPKGQEPDCRQLGSELLRCLCLPSDRIKSVQVKRITIDIDFKDRDC